MDSVGELLTKNNYQEPDVIRRIKDYARLKYKTELRIGTSSKGIILIVSGSSLASKIRFDLPEMKRQLKLNENISIRIG